jgi:hypothetical protein
MSRDAGATAWKIGAALLPWVLAHVGKEYAGITGGFLILAGWAVGGAWVWLWFFVRR